MGETAATDPHEEPAARAGTNGLAHSSARLLIAVGAVSFFCGVGATLLTWTVLRRAVPAASAASSSAEPAASGSGAGSAAPSSSFMRQGKSDAEGPEAAARRALGRLRDGIGVCVKDVIGVLPGTSPAVPVTMKLMKNGAYASLSSDYRSPVFVCAHYREADPQAFQIQWQRAGAANEGTGVAWIDTNGDGAPDRAFGFTAKLVKKREVTLGEIAPIDPMPKQLPAR